MRRRIAAIAGSVVLLSAGISSGSEAEIVRLTPHRVVYDLALAKSGGARSVESARGRIAFDFSGDACEGYALNYRQVTVLETGESGARTSDLRTNTFESGDGSSMRFKTDSQMEGNQRSAVDGDAEIAGGALTVRLKQPKPESFSVPGGALFPTEHMKRLITAGRAGETTLSVKVFDGSDDGRKVYDTLAVIGRRIEPGQTEGLESAARQEGLSRLPRWPVTLSYFAPGEGERTPIYTISFDLYENGVSRALRLDYGDFALKGEMQNLELQAESSCRR
jgi:hypothetical protein